MNFCRLRSYITDFFQSLKVCWLRVLALGTLRERLIFLCILLIIIFGQYYLLCVAGSDGGVAIERFSSAGKLHSLSKISAALDSRASIGGGSWGVVLMVILSTSVACVVTAGFCVTIVFRRLNALHFNLAAISHDAKGPLTAARGNLERALAAKDDVSVVAIRKSVGSALASIESVGNLINDVHYVSKLETSGNLALHERCDLSDLIGDITVSLHGKFEAKGIALTTKLPDRNALAFGDISLLERLIRNLLENALRYTERGGEVSVALDNVGRSQRISISDSGCGIDSKDIPKIFEKNFRGGNVSSATEGSGIGLTVARQIAALHNSRLHVASELGKGTTVSWEIPMYDGKPLHRRSAQTH